MSTRNDFFHAILNRDLQIGDTDLIRDIREQNILIGDRYIREKQNQRDPYPSPSLMAFPQNANTNCRADALFVGIVTRFNRHKILDCWTIDESEIKT